jgi:hypothetical protein
MARISFFDFISGISHAISPQDSYWGPQQLVFKVEKRGKIAHGCDPCQRLPGARRVRARSEGEYLKEKEWR